jgi:hypothetical protein
MNSPDWPAERFEHHPAQPAAGDLNPHHTAVMRGNRVWIASGAGRT